MFQHPPAPGRAGFVLGLIGQLYHYEAVWLRGPPQADKLS